MIFALRYDKDMKRSILQEQYQNEDFLLSALRQSDRNAYSCLFRKYYPMLCAYCHKFISLEDSEEIVQDVLFWLWAVSYTHLTLPTILRV